MHAISLDFDYPEILHDMGQKELSDRLEKLTARVTVVEKELSVPSRHVAGKWKWDRNFFISVAAFVVAAIALPIMLVAWIEPHLANDLKSDVSLEVSAQLKGPVDKINQLSADIAEIKGKLEVLNPLITEMYTKQIRASAKYPARLKTLVDAARTSKIPIDPDEVKHVGSEVLKEAEHNTVAWGAALSLVDYRTALNNSFMPFLENGTLRLWHGNTHIETPPNETAKETERSQVISVFGETDQANAAHLEGLDKVQKGPGPKFITFEINREDNALLLDGLYMKNVIVKNSRITYRGGPVKLENVLFVNCTFQMPTPSNPTIDFADAVLQSPSVTFSRSS